MVTPIPKWVWKRYAVLWKEFNGKEFTFDEAKEVLKHLDRNTISAMFSELKKSGWLKVKLDEKDSRKRVYRLLNPTEATESAEIDIKQS